MGWFIHDKNIMAYSEVQEKGQHKRDETLHDQDISKRKPKTIWRGGGRRGGNGQLVMQSLKKNTKELVITQRHDHFCLP